MKEKQDVENEMKNQEKEKYQTKSKQNAERGGNLDE